MKDIDFLSKGIYRTTGDYIDRKIYFNVSDKFLEKSSKNLYTPIKLSGKIFKSVFFLFHKIQVKRKSQLIKLFESEFKFKNIDTSLYVSTDRKKKIVLIFYKKNQYYLKIASDKSHNIIIDKEIENYNLFPSENKLEILKKGKINNLSFFLSKKVLLKNTIVDTEVIVNSLNKLKTKKIKFSKHKYYKKYLAKIENIIHKEFMLKSKNRIVFECIEHGDFTPWNFKLSNENTPIFFDFEDVEKNGLINMDLINYYYSYFLLIRNLKPKKIFKEITKILSNVEDLDLYINIYIVKKCVDDNIYLDLL